MPEITVFHGTSKANGELFCREGIAADQFHPKISTHPEDQVPGIYVTPDLETAKRIAGRIGDCVVAIEIDEADLLVPPLLKAYDPQLTVEDCLKNSQEPQAYLIKRVEPEKVRIVFYRDLPSA